MTGCVLSLQCWHTLLKRKSLTILWSWTHNLKWINSLKVSYLAYINFPGYFPKSMESDKPSNTFFNGGKNYAYILCLVLEGLYVAKWTLPFLIHHSAVSSSLAYAMPVVCICTVPVKLLDLKRNIGASVLGGILGRGLRTVC